MQGMETIPNALRHATLQRLSLPGFRVKTNMSKINGKNKYKIYSSTRIWKDKKTNVKWFCIFVVSRKTP